MANARTATDVAPPAAGLTGSQVAERVTRGQVNDVPHRSSRSVAAIVRSNVFTLFNGIIGVLFMLILIFGDLPDALFGLVIVANSAIGIVQELRAKRTLDRLAVVGEAPVRIIRDGRPVELAPREIVLDDLILLGTGDKVVVDGRVAETDGMEVDESLLTGEADPVHKRPGDPVLSGSFVVAGSGSFVATKVGRSAYAAQLVEEASRFTLAHSELRSGINRFLRFITWIILPIGVLLTISQLLANQSFPHAVAGTVAGVAPMIPEGLVLLTSVAFAVGVVRLGRRQCLVQELPAIEGLARVDVLCVDKTGTLTEPGMDLDEIRMLRPDLPVAEALAALIATDPRPNTTMQAAASSAGAPPDWRVTAKVPFSSARKWSGAAFADRGTWVFGAPDMVLADGDADRATAESLAAEGLRVLVLGQAPDGALDRPDELGPVAAAALVVLRQRLRAEAPATLRYFAEQGVAVKVISGDNAAAVGAIGRPLGVPHADSPVDARDLPAERTALAEVLETHSVFGRVTPQQKRQMVAALQARGHTVAMTGDGVNDVLALKDADLGVAMGSGSGASRAVAKIVLLDDNFASLPRVVAEGRRVIGNIERVANLFLTKTVYSILLALSIGLVDMPFPFLPRHVTLIGTLTIGVPAFFLALAPSAARARPGFVRRVLHFAVPAGVVAAAATFAAYYVAHDNPASELREDRSTAALTLFIVAVAVLVIVARPLVPWKLGLVAGVVGSFVLVAVVPGVSEFFALTLTNLRNNLTGAAFAATAVLALIAVLRADRWLRPTQEAT